MKPITGLTRKRAKAGMTSPAAPRMTSESLKAEDWIGSAIPLLRGRARAKASAQRQKRLARLKIDARAARPRPAPVSPRRAPSSPSAGATGALVSAWGVRVPVDLVEIEAAVGEVAHRAFGARPGEIGEVDVADRQRLDILARLGGDAVAREGEVARRQDAALRILDVHILDLGQIADIARHHDEALVLDRARLAAIAHAQIALPAVGAERHEQDARALVDQPAGEFGEFANRSRSARRSGRSRSGSPRPRRRP